MPDNADMGTKVSDVFLEVALSNRVVYSGISSKRCLECDNKIPKKRRETIKGCKLCIECATVKEAKSKQYSNSPA